MKIEKPKCVFCGKKPYGKIDVGITEADGTYLARIPVCERHYKLLDKIGQEEEKRRGVQLIAIPYKLLQKEGVTIDNGLLDYYTR